MELQRTNAILQFEITKGDRRQQLSWLRHGGKAVGKEVKLSLRATSPQMRSGTEDNRQDSDEREYSWFCCELASQIKWRLCGRFSRERCQDVFGKHLG